MYYKGALVPLEKQRS